MTDNRQIFLNATRLDSRGPLLLYSGLDPFPGYQGFTAWVPLLLPMSEAYGIVASGNKPAWDLDAVVSASNELEELWTKQEKWFVFPEESDDMHINQMIVLMAFKARIACYDAGRLMLAYMMPKVLRPSEKQIDEWCAEILECCEVVNRRMVAHVLIRLLLPATLVACHAPTAKRRAAALDLVRDWPSKDRSLVLLCQLAIEHVNRVYKREGIPTIPVEYSRTRDAPPLRQALPADQQRQASAIYNVEDRQRPF
jgi:hypothetical protein